MRLQLTRVSMSLFVFCACSVWAQDTKPNFSGAWFLNKEKSDLSGPMGGSGGRMGEPGTGEPRMGGGGMSWPGMGGHRGGGLGGPSMGGPGMGGPGMGGPEMGGSPTGEPGTGGSSQEGRRSGRRMGAVAEKLVIEHAEPNLTIQRDFKSDEGEQIQELKYTTDGKSNKNALPDGRSNKSKTHWEGSQLVTKSNMDTPMGSMEITETRSLSADGKTMTLEQYTQGGQRNWTRRLVYTRETSEPKAVGNEK
jgi:hypothetical protein